VSGGNPLATVYFLVVFLLKVSEVLGLYASVLKVLL
jgi:hypothetical protein